MDDTPTAACLAIGSELLGTRKLDRNSLTITGLLARHGVEVTEKRVVGDEVERIASALTELLDRVDVVVTTGGLGPTADDVTREAVARALGKELVHDHEVEGWVRDRYRALDREVPGIAHRMARVVEGARPLRPERGTAPGQMLTTRGRLLVVLPGVPTEMEQMLERDVEPEVASLHPGVRRLERTLLIGGVPESTVEERVEHLYGRFDRDAVSILASPGVVRLVLGATGEPASAERRLQEMTRAFTEVLGDDLVAVDAPSLERVVLEALSRRGQRLAVAESCTGGLLGAALTAEPGASAVFLGGVLSYADEVKQQALGVDADLLQRVGAVSNEVAEAMARGVRDRFGADWGIGITGIAGPSGGTEDKPVGLVHWAVAGPDRVAVTREVFSGDRERIRTWAVAAAVDTLRRELERS